MSSGKVPHTTFRIVPVATGCPNVVQRLKLTLNSSGLREVERNAAGNFLVTCTTRPAKLMVGDDDSDTSGRLEMRQRSQVQIVVLDASGRVIATSQSLSIHKQNVEVVQELATQAINNLAFTAPL